MIAPELAARLAGLGNAAGEMPLRGGGGPDWEATAWAALALALAGHPAAPALGHRLAAAQAADGRISIAPFHPGNAWPTALALLAWRALGLDLPARRRAVDFLLGWQGRTWERPAAWPFGHDPALVGWPWVAGTSSWIEPTALALLALAAEGEAAHPRAVAGRALLVDRQLPGGGWNYGNPSAFGRELEPMPESTGPALAALAGFLPTDRVAPSLARLARDLAGLETPQALGWALLGLAAWGLRPADADARLAACTAADPAPGEPYDAGELALLLAAAVAPDGLAAAVVHAGRAA